MTKKQINVIVDGTCDDCPFRVYDAYYSIGQDSGNNCSHPDAPHTRIADDKEVEAYNRACHKHKQEKASLFPPTEPLPKYPLNIPTWCPLPDAETL